MTEDFASSLSNLLTTEGGYVNDPKDPGGPTNEGVTQHNYDLWRIAHHQPTQSVRFITPDEVQAFYQSWYWSPSGCDQLPSGVDYCLFDFAVNSGPHEAIKLLQRAVNVSDDGFIGPKTLAAVKAASAYQVIDALCDERLAFMQKLPNWTHDSRGWTRRVTTVEAVARAMA